MPRLPEYATKKDLESHKKEVKKMIKEAAKKDIKQDKKLLKRTKK